MAIFKFNTTDTWQIAFTHGHSAMELLRYARNIEKDYAENKAKMDDVEEGRLEHLKLIGTQDSLTKQMLKLSGASIILFQGMMEALINHAMESEAALAGVSGKSFRDKWVNSLEALNQPTSSFLAYLSDIYKKYRNPLVHPSQTKANTFDDITSSALAAGYRQGWEAFRLLYDALGRPLDPNSWRLMCEAHQVPEFA